MFAVLLFYVDTAILRLFRVHMYLSPKVQHEILDIFLIETPSFVEITD